MPSAIPSVDGWRHYVPQAVMRRCWPAAVKAVKAAAVKAVKAAAFKAAAEVKFGGDDGR